LKQDHIEWGGGLEDLIEPMEKKTSTSYEVNPRLEELNSE